MGISNMKAIEFIFGYEGKNELERSVTKDVSKRINDWMESPSSTIEDDYIDRQIIYFLKFVKLDFMQS